MWLRMIIISTIKDISHSLAHLVPLGTPGVLVPLIVLIELIRNVIRPLTLSVRLAANIVAGHLLLSLISGSLVEGNIRVLMLGIGALVLLMLLENGVALIQAYVFSMLPSLYLNEVNYVRLNYLNNNIWHLKI
jgi:F-type H+-transporting ATPase subunit a